MVFVAMAVIVEQRVEPTSWIFSWGRSAQTAVDGHSGKKTEQITTKGVYKYLYCMSYHTIH